MPEPTPIPMPGVLEPDGGHLRGSLNAAEDPEQQLSQLRQALADACGYGRELWRAVDALRGYLLHSLPADPRAPGLHRTATAPTGPDDEQGWQDWMAAYAEAHSVLAGPRGDSGFGVSEAQREAQARRSAPNLRLLAEHPELTSRQPASSARPASLRSRLPGVLAVAAMTLAVRAVLVRRLRHR
ncbi:MAG: hypothetical protein ACJ74U_09780 [Jatrophihabitantaceae bacterium]